MRLLENDRSFRLVAHDTFFLGPATANFSFWPAAPDFSFWPAAFSFRSVAPDFFWPAAPDFVLVSFFAVLKLTAVTLPSAASNVLLFATTLSCAELSPSPIASPEVVRSAAFFLPVSSVALRVNFLSSTSSSLPYT